MKIGFKNLKEQKAKIMEGLGVPRGLIKPFQLDVSKFITNTKVEHKNTVKNVPAKEQISFIEDLKKHDYKEPCLIFIESNGQYMIARQLAFYLFTQAYVQAKSEYHETQGSFPQWHYLTSSFENPMMEAEARRREPQLLVLDNCSTDALTTNMKVEKMREILNYYTDRTVIVLFSGLKSFQFSKEHFELKPDKIIGVDLYRAQTIKDMTL